MRDALADTVPLNQRSAAADLKAVLPVKLSHTCPPAPLIYALALVMQAACQTGAQQLHVSLCKGGHPCRPSRPFPVGRCAFYLRPVVLCTHPVMRMRLPAPEAQATEPR